MSPLVLIAIGLVIFFLYDGLHRAAAACVYIRNLR